MVLLSIYRTPPGRSYGQTLLKQEKLWKNLPKTGPLVVVKCKVWNAGILFATSGMQNVGQHCCWLFGGVEDFSNCWQSWLNNNVRSLPTLWNVDGIILDISQSVMISGVFSQDMMQEDLSEISEVLLVISVIRIFCSFEKVKSHFALARCFYPYFHLHKISLNPLTFVFFSFSLNT